MSVIFRAPLALLDFLATKAVGQNPATLQTTVQPTLDLTPFYLAGGPVEGLEGVFNSVTGLQDEGFTLATVPPGEVWSLISLSVRITVAVAGDTAKARVAIRAPNGLTVAVGPDMGVNPAVNVGTQDTVGWSSLEWFGRPFLLPTGWILGASTTRATTTGAPPGPTFSIRAAFVRYSV